MINYNELNKEIKLKTRSIFDSAKKYRNKKKQFGIDWNFLIQTLYPFYDSNKYHVDHIIPLNTFNFIHEDGSINIIEIKKAWSPANLKIIDKEENLHKGKSTNYYYPLRFEFVFCDIDKVKNIYAALNRLNRIYKNIKINW